MFECQIVTFAACIEMEMKAEFESTETEAKILLHEKYCFLTQSLFFLRFELLNGSKMGVNAAIKYLVFLDFFNRFCACNVILESYCQLRTWIRLGLEQAEIYIRESWIVSNF